MTSWRKVQGDAKDTIVVALAGVANLNNVTSLAAHVWRNGDTAETLTATVLDTAARTVTVDLGGATGWLSDAEPGTWNLEVQVTFADGTVLTWPAGLPDIISVRTQGA